MKPCANALVLHAFRINDHRSCVIVPFAQPKIKTIWRNVLASGSSNWRCTGVSDACRIFEGRSRCKWPQFQNLVTAETCKRTRNARRADLSKNPDRQLFDIACDAAWLLKQRGLTRNRVHIQRRYRELLRVHRFIYYRRVRFGALEAKYHPHYSKLFRALKRKEGIEAVALMLPNLYLDPQKFCSPLWHLLLIRFLGYSAKSFFEHLIESQN